MEWHPFSKLFPMLPDDQLQELAEDIRQNGLEQPILVDIHERIIDGRNRSAACKIAGVEPVYEPFAGSDDEILKKVISLNVHRRHLSESQRAMVAAEIANLKVGRPVGLVDDKSIRHKCLIDSNGVTRAQAAELLNVSGRSVGAARKVKSSGIPELADAVIDGSIAVKRAEIIASLPKQEQPAAMQAAKEASQGYDSQ